jgi:hypothetical protein
VERSTLYGRVKALRPEPHNVDEEWSSRFCPQVCRMARNPMRTPRCLGSAATSSMVSATVRNSNGRAAGHYSCRKGLVDAAA